MRRLEIINAESECFIVSVLVDETFYAWLIIINIKKATSRTSLQSDVFIFEIIESQVAQLQKQVLQMEELQRQHHVRHMLGCAECIVST